MLDPLSLPGSPVCIGYFNTIQRLPLAVAYPILTEDLNFTKVLGELHWARVFYPLDSPLIRVGFGTMGLLALLKNPAR